MKKPFISMRNKLFFSILLIFLLSYSILFYTSLVNFDSFLEKEVVKDLQASLEFTQNHFFSRADQVRLAIQLPAIAPPTQQHIRQGDVVWLKGALERWKKVIPFADVLTLVDPQKRVIARLGNDNHGDAYQLPVVVEKVYRERLPVVSTELVSEKFLRSEGIISRDIISAGEAMMMTISIPIISSSGEMLGCIVAGDIINKDDYYSFKEQKIFGREARFFITQRGKKIFGSMKDDPAYPTLQPTEIYSNLKQGIPYRGEARVGDQLYQTALEPIKNSSGEIIGSMSVALSKEDFINIRKDNRRSLLVSAMVGILLSFAIAYVAARHITKPLQDLSRGVNKIEEGDLNQRVIIDTGDELERLADSFNRMANSLAARDITIKAKNSQLQELNEHLERKVAERTAELRMEMERMETVLTNMVEGIVVTDQEDRVILFNPAAQKIFDLVPHRIVGQSLERLYELYGVTPLADHIDSLRSDEIKISSREEELEVKGKKLKVNLSSLMDETGDFAGVVMSVRDVTLEEAVDRMKTEFISTVSHELRTPLTSMKGSLQFILGKGKGLTETERELLSVCQRNTERLIRLINDILDISKIEEGRMDFSFKPQYLGRLIAYSIKEIRPLAVEPDITLLADNIDNLPPVYVDRDRLVQVLTNLLSNAVKFSPRGMAVTVSAKREGNYILVSVADQGPIIQWSERGKLFKKFQRLDNVETKDRGGTGLGLAICKEIVEKHHGKIYYNTGMTGGNIFTFSVPVFEEHHEP